MNKKKTCIMAMMTKQALAQIIKQRRVMYGLTQSELARTSGIPVYRVSQVERGFCFPPADFLVKVATPLGINASELLAYAACAAINDPGVRDKTILDITKALKSAVANNKTGV